MSRHGALSWQLHVLMVQRNLRTNVALRLALATDGLALSAEQVGRIVKGPPKQLPLDVLASLCRILHCMPSDLLVWRADAEAPPQQRARRPKAPRRPAAPSTPVARSATKATRGKTARLTPEEIARIAGPAVSATMPHPLSKQSV